MGPKDRDVDVTSFLRIENIVELALNCQVPYATLLYVGTMLNTQDLWLRCEEGNNAMRAA